MKDFNGNELHVGDFVAFLEPNYRHMVQGRVIGFTPKQIRIEYPQNGWHNGVKGPYMEQCLRERSYVAKIEVVDKAVEEVL